MKNNLLPIAKEGVKYIGTAAALAVVFAIIDLDLLAFLITVLLVALIYSFRNPERQLASFDELSVVSVCDGVVKSIDELSDDEYAYKITVDGSFFDVSVLRTPFDASLVDVEHVKGASLPKKSLLFEDLNENIKLVFEDKLGNKIKVIHRVKQSFVPLFLDLIPTQTLLQTARYGFMVNGETTLYLPRNFRVNVSVGKELKAAESLMGYFS